MQAQLSLGLRAEQKLALVPQMLQSIEVLQLAAAELGELVEQEAAQNETLELGAAPGPAAPRDGDGDHRAFLESLPGRGRTLLDAVREQLAWSGLPGPLRDAVWTLALHVDERGLLPQPEAELRRLVPAGMFEEARAVLQSLEPRGIGAPSAVEAMLLQIPEDDPDREALAAMLRGHLEELAQRKLPAVARALGRSVDEVQRLVDRLAALEPRPAAGFEGAGAAVVQPDAVVELDEGGEIQVVVEERGLPVLGVSEEYANLAARRDTGVDVRRYLRDKLSSARGLIAAVEQRRETLGRVVAATMARQRPFLEEGPAAIRPLRMADVAEPLGLHPSTVSRAVAGKSVQTPRGVFPLRVFFDGARRSAGSGAGRRGLQERLRALIDAEDPCRPRSDDELVGLLAAEGLKVARRTVTKYRKELGIPSTWRRRRYGSTS